MKHPSASVETASKAGETSTTIQLKEDKFASLWSKKDSRPATVSISVGEGMDYGALKVSATVTLACDQNEATIDKAGELAFYKALELVRDGWSELTKGT